MNNFDLMKLHSGAARESLVNDWRTGQAYFNVFAKMDPAGATRLQLNAPEVDPFYDDEKIGDFIEWVTANG